MTHRFSCRLIFFALALAGAALPACSHSHSSPAKVSSPAKAPLVKKARPVTLRAADATMNGSDAKLEGAGSFQHVGYWERESTSLSWTTHDIEPGTYTVDAMYSLDPQYSGSTFAMTVGTQTLSKKLEATKDWDDYHSLNLGEVQIEKAGDATLTMTVTDKPKLFVMNLQNVTLTPQ